MQGTNTFYRKFGNTYYSTYDLTEIGFTVSDASPYDREKVEKSYDSFINDRKSWMEEYAWGERDLQRAENIEWLKPFIEEKPVC